VLVSILNEERTVDVRLFNSVVKLIRSNIERQESLNCILSQNRFVRFLLDTYGFVLADDRHPCVADLLTLIEALCRFVLYGLCCLNVAGTPLFMPTSGAIFLCVKAFTRREWHSRALPTLHRLPQH
jgi:hypothetical protein